MLYCYGEHFWCRWREQGQKFNFQVILNDFVNVKINSQKVAATWGYDQKMTKRHVNLISILILHWLQRTPFLLSESLNLRLETFDLDFGLDNYAKITNPWKVMNFSFYARNTSIRDCSQITSSYFGGIWTIYIVNHTTITF